jgi:hypothetical protein
LEARSRLPTLERGRGSSLNLHQNKPPTWLVHISRHPWVLGQATGIWIHLTHHGLDSGVSHHLTHYSILCDSLRHPRPNVTFSRDSRDSHVGVSKLSRNCPGWSPGTLGAHNSRLRSLIATRSKVVGSQTGSLTPGPSFAHNLGYRCLNDQCETIFYIYASRPFQWHQEHLNARCFGPFCRALHIRES